MAFEMVKGTVCGLLCSALLVASGYLMAFPRRHQNPQRATATIVVEAGKANCAVDIDSTASGATGTQGTLTVNGIDPGDHYVHVRCPGETETTNFVSPKAGESAVLKTRLKSSVENQGTSSLQSAEGKMELRRIVRRAADERADGKFDEAVKDLRYAATLDPENPDLHRELAITFLLQRDWQQARIEMLEALRHDPNDADAHSNLGYALERLGEYKAALDQYRIATHLDPSDDSYRQHYLEALGKYAVQQGEMKRKKK